MEQGCDKLIPYYLKKGVYNSKNTFIEGAVFISPRGTSYINNVKPGKRTLPTATRTVVVNGAKDSYINGDVNTQLGKIPRTEVGNNVLIFYHYIQINLIRVISINVHFFQLT